MELLNHFGYAEFMNKHVAGQAGFSHLLVIGVVVVLGVVGFAGWRVYTKDLAKPSTTASQFAGTSMETAQKRPDSASTIESPQKIATKEGDQYFYYGAPAGHNNASPKKILITLHGTGGSAENDYEIWKPYIQNTQFALAALNWWDGSGDQTSDYSTPEAISTQIHDFLTSQGYAAKDVVVFEGFSRGSANSYSVVAHDRASQNPVIDVAVSSSGGVQTAYYELMTKSIAAKAQLNIFADVYWILACGSKDPNPERDGCEAMETAKQFVSAKGASVLGVLSDPDSGHGALTTSKLNLPKQMFELIEQKIK